MQILVRTIQGQTICIDIRNKDTVFDLKLRIQDIQAIPPEIQTLTFQGKKMLNNDCIGMYGIKPFSLINLNACIRAKAIILPQNELISIKFKVDGYFWRIICYNIDINKMSTIKYCDSIENISILYKEIIFQLHYSTLLTYKTFKSIFIHYFGNNINKQVFRCLYFNNNNNNKSNNACNGIKISSNIIDSIKNEMLSKLSDGKYCCDNELQLNYMMYNDIQMKQLNIYVDLIKTDIIELETTGLEISRKIDRYKNEIILSKNWTELTQLRDKILPYIKNGSQKDINRDVSFFYSQMEDTRQSYIDLYNESITPIMCVYHIHPYINI